MTKYMKIQKSPYYKDYSKHQPFKLSNQLLQKSRAKSKERKGNKHQHQHLIHLSVIGWSPLVRIEKPSHSIHHLLPLLFQGKKKKKIINSNGGFMQNFEKINSQFSSKLPLFHLNCSFSSPSFLSINNPITSFCASLFIPLASDTQSPKDSLWCRRLSFHITIVYHSQP